MDKNNQIKVAIGADHGGYRLKESLKSQLRDNGYEVTDCGTFAEKSVDYPKIAAEVAALVSTGKARFAVIVDGAGIGSAMVANKFPRVRAAMCYDVSSAINAREHNDANILTLGGGLIGVALASQIMEAFLTHECTVERHQRRVGMIEKLDQEKETGTSEDSTHAGSNNMDINPADMERIIRRVQDMLQKDSSAPQTGDNCQTDMICRCGVCVERTPETLRNFINYGVERLGYHDATGADCVPDDVARCIDHTLLKPQATADDVRRLCAEAREYEFAAVCISPSYVWLAAKELAGSPVEVCTVVGFPSGAHLPEIKALEARRAIRDGAKEIDMVINVGALKSGDDELVYRDIRMVCEACEDGGALSKVIIEAALLTNDEKRRACELAKKAKANYVKTSTGFGPHGATVEDVMLMQEVVAGSGVAIKAAGGISSFEDAEKMIQAGASRLGASAGIKILQQAKTVTISQ